MVNKNTYMRNMNVFEEVVQATASQDYYIEFLTMKVPLNINLWFWRSSVNSISTNFDIVIRLIDYDLIESLLANFSIFYPLKTYGKQKAFGTLARNGLNQYVQ